ncbi:MAG TPA: hypothetical protein ENH89_00190 [Aurantimonas coralicida]|uniref:Uncharacterized protein n=1 Tax=Aurantimonas coralicida TaxID=182270 RepID=A0A9C9NCF7_9HYPH|nr:hypothetical protein [Aurantimonas coralicida]
MPSLRNVVMIDTCRGVLRVRKWPKKRGTPKSASQRWWNDWFRQANLLTHYVDAASQRRAIELTAGTGKYPRDILLQAMRGRLYTWIDQNGNRWYPMAGIQDISESLDVLAQTVGSVLVRAVDRWRAPPPGTVGQVLTNVGPDDPPVWADAGGGGGVSQVTLPATPIIPDGTKNAYDIDVSIYATLDVSLDGIGFASSDTPWLRFSTDGGISFRAGASDYLHISVTSLAEGRSSNAQWFLSTALAAANHFAQLSFGNLRTGRASGHGVRSHNATTSQAAAGFANFDGPITDIRIFSKNGNNFNAGTIRLVGLVAA